MASVLDVLANNEVLGDCVHIGWAVQILALSLGYFVFGGKRYQIAILAAIPCGSTYRIGSTICIFLFGEEIGTDSSAQCALSYQLKNISTMKPLVVIATGVSGWRYCFLRLTSFLRA